MIPSIVKITKSGKESLDLLSYDFLENRRIWIVGEINDSLATEVITQIEYLDTYSSGDIYIYINSPGGSVTAGFAIVDAMSKSKNDIVTVCTGIAASMGAFILSCGTKGKRFATALSEVMIHQPIGGVQGQASDIELTANHIIRIKNTLNSILATNTEQPLEIITRDTDRDTYLTALQAKNMD